ncbi:MAG: spermidine synthase [Candidatus Endobugula sp.]|jgi:spermidine synthase
MLNYKSLINDKAYLRDVLLLGIMAVGASCGMIYEYLIAHYAGRIVGSVDTAVYGIIGVMIVAMGLGAFYSRNFKCPYTGFAWLEALIALVGGTAVLLMALIFSLAYILPLQLQHAFGIHETINLSGGPIFVLEQLAESFPYIVGFLIGFLLGMEIPFIARIRQDLHDERLVHNAGTIYGADYIGGGVGAAIWVFFCLNQPIIVSATLTALLNIVLGAIFLGYFYKQVKGCRFLIPFKLAVATLLSIALFNGTAWMNALSNMLYTDRVAYEINTPYQNLVITERPLGNGKASIINLYINGHIQFSSADEVAYHSLLVIPPLLASARQKNILIIGGGDGLAAKEVLRWSPDTVTLVDLDPAIIKLFRGDNAAAPEWLNQRLVSLNDNALNDPRLHYINGDAFKIVEQLNMEGKSYDAIIVDLPDPNHPDLNKLYSDYFYAKLGSLLSADGAISIQSTSPYHSRKAFLSIGKTIAAVGFNVVQYHANIPSFGEWGWSLATKLGQGPKQRLIAASSRFPEHAYLNYEQMMSSFTFSNGFWQDIDTIKVNHLSSPTLYSYHAEGWRKDEGIYNVK